MGKGKNQQNHYPEGETENDRRDGDFEGFVDIDGQVNQSDGHNGECEGNDWPDSQQEPDNAAEDSFRKPAKPNFENKTDIFTKAHFRANRINFALLLSMLTEYVMNIFHMVIRATIQ